MDRHDVDDLLAPGALCGHERDRVLGQVLSQVAPPPERFRLRRSLALASIGVAACAGVVIALRGKGRLEDPFASRGSVGAAAHLELVCSGGRLEACPHGSHLVFGVTGEARAGYLSAYAEPIADGERIWYFPNERSATAPGVVPGQPVERVIEIGPEHPVGRYSVHVLITTRPLSRAESLHPDEKSVLASQVVDFEVVP